MLRRTPAPRAMSFVVLAVLMSLAIFASAARASGKDVIRDCTDDEVLAKTYTQKEYKDALAQLGSDSDQYGDCRDIIKSAQLKALRDSHKQRAPTTNGGGSGGGSGAGGGASGGASSAGGYGNPPATKQLESATPGERSAVDIGRKAAQTAVNVQGAAVKPGLGSSSDLPAPLLILLALVLAGALALAATRLRALVLARRA